MTTETANRNVGEIDVSQSLKDKLSAIYPYQYRPKLDPQSALQILEAEWLYAYNEASRRIGEKYFTENEWYALYAAFNGVVIVVNQGPILYDEISDYFFYSERGCCDSHPLLKDPRGQRRLLEKVAGLSHFEELVVYSRIREWWGNNASNIIDSE
jgi:hypothetical protein